MKKILLLFAIASYYNSYAQKEETIKINNSRLNINIEAAYYKDSFTIDGTGKFFTERYNEGGYSEEFVSTKDPFTYTGGINFEYNLLPDRKWIALGAGLFYTKHGAAVYQATENNGDYTKSNYDPVCFINQSSVQIPIYLQVRLFDWNGNRIYLIGGVMFDYLLSAKAQPVKIDSSEYNFDGTETIASSYNTKDAFKSLNIYPYAGIKLQTWKVYLNCKFGIIPAKNILNTNFADYDTSPHKFDQKFMGSIGIGFYLK